jgi:hypothetical protein
LLLVIYDVAATSVTSRNVPLALAALGLFTLKFVLKLAESVFTLLPKLVLQATDYPLACLAWQLTSGLLM